MIKNNEIENLVGKYSKQEKENIIVQIRDGKREEVPKELEEFNCLEICEALIVGVKRKKAMAYIH